MPGTSFDDVMLVNPSRIRPATSDGIALAEAELGVRMPPGYAAFVERLGEGAPGNFVRGLAPARLPDLTQYSSRPGRRARRSVRKFTHSAWNLGIERLSRTEVGFPVSVVRESRAPRVCRDSQRDVAPKAVAWWPT